LNRAQGAPAALNEIVILPWLHGTVFISVADLEKPAILEAARKFQELGFRIKATNGTYQFLREASSTMATFAKRRSNTRCRI
jgi:carbamoyl-phosphate synthase large subunit